MRLVTQLPLELALNFSFLLKTQKIENEMEHTLNEKGEDVGLIWVIEEDDYPKALVQLTTFEKDPKSFAPKNKPFLLKPKLSSSSHHISEPTPFLAPKPKRAPFITYCLIALSIFIFMMQQWTSKEIPREIQTSETSIIFAPPIMKELLFDWPKAYALMDELYSTYSSTSIDNTPENAKGILALKNQIQHTPYWQGLYEKMVEKIKSTYHTQNEHAPLFEKIKEGQYYRLFTPALLHGNLLHILFNIMWILVLGVQIERKIGALKTLILILITAILSNIAQYLMSGPNFLGLSGIVVAMVGFIYVREKKAPWEGYLMQKSTFYFILVYVLGLFAIQFILFMLEIFDITSLSIGIANTAHIVGGLAGALLGSFKFFERKSIKAKKFFNL